MNYDRWKPTRETSIAYYIFSVHHTELNHMYWSHNAAKQGAYSLTRTQSKTTLADTIFPNKDNLRHRKISLVDWSRDYKAFDNWTRLAAIIAISGYFEMYINSIVDMACQSCPAILVGGTKEIDGIKLLKSRDNYSFLDHAKKCSKGAWQTRISEYKRIFGSCPDLLVDSISDLDKIRKLRNDIGHAFGRNTREDQFAVQQSINTPHQLKQNTFLNHLALLDKVAKEIDSHLACNFIGSYETRLSHF